MPVDTCSDQHIGSDNVARPAVAWRLAPCIRDEWLIAAEAGATLTSASSSPGSDGVQAGTLGFPPKYCEGIS